MMKAVCLLSGGMDSTTLAYYAQHEGYDILALHINYGQRTESRERLSARKIAEVLPADELVEVDISYLRQFGASSLTDHTLPVDEFDDTRGCIPNTYVPFRNGNLLSIATSYAESRSAEAVFIGVQSLDYSGYPDCRPEFIKAFQDAIHAGTRDGIGIRLHTPFISLTKKDILAIGKSLGVPYEHTWSCYQDNEVACGVCGACHYRREAFRALGIHDPIKYSGEE